MKNLYKIKLITVLVSTLLFFSCETDSENINAANENNVFLSEQGIVEATTGLKLLYSTSCISSLVEATTITTRQAAASNTFVNAIELEQGGQALPNNNSTVGALWSNMLRLIKNSDEVIAAASTFPLKPGVKSGIIANAKLYKALAIGALSQNFQNVITVPNKDNNATFVSRQQGLLYAIQLLDEAKSEITATPVDASITTKLNTDLNLINTVNALLARFNLFAGNYENAITNANLVDLTLKSVFKYNALNPNPIFSRVVQNNNYKPIEGFGLPAALAVNPADGRTTFYLGAVPTPAANAISKGGGNFPLRLLTGFFAAATTDLPVYLTDEIRLIKAEALIRKSSPDLPAATTELNTVLTGIDPFGLNANLPAYSGSITDTDLLLEIYKNRYIELFFSGTSLEDSRRFGRPSATISSSAVYTDERNRNFYPTPVTERNNNPNTPADPTI